MTRPRIPLLGLMGLVVLIAVGLAALKSPSRLWASGLVTLAFVLLGFATLGAIAREGKARMPWAGFALFGWLACLNLPTGEYSTGPPPLRLFLPTIAIERLYQALHPIPAPGPPDPLTGAITVPVVRVYSPFNEQIVYSLGVLGFATLGGLLGRMAWPRGGREPSERERC